MSEHRDTSNQDQQVPRLPSARPDRLPRFDLTIRLISLNLWLWELARLTNQRALSWCNHLRAVYIRWQASACLELQVDHQRSSLDPGWCRKRIDNVTYLRSHQSAEVVLLLEPSTAELGL